MPGLDLPTHGGSWSPVRQTEKEQAAPPLAEQREITTRLNDEASQTIGEGAEFNVISSRWWQHWKEYVKEESSESDMRDAFVPQGDGNSAGGIPGPIDNAHLVEPTNEAEASTSTVDYTRAEGTSWRLKRGLAEEADYVLVPHQLWRTLQAWYGGGPEIARRVVSMGRRGQFAVEVYPLTLRLHSSSDKKWRNSLVISKTATVKELAERICDLLKVNKEDIRLWDFYGGKRQKLLEDPEQILDEAEIQMDNQIMIDEKTADGQWTGGHDGSAEMENGHPPPSQSLALAIVPQQPLRVGPLGSSSTTSIAGGPLSHYTDGGANESTDMDADGLDSTAPKSAPPMAAVGGSGGLGAMAVGSSLSLASSSSYHTAGSNYEDGSTSSGFGMTLRSSPQPGGRLLGLTGLVNLGNTCFMNSALQCLVHTPPLVEYFCNSNYIKDLNTTNPLGMEGEIANSFGELTKKLWSSSFEAVAPRAFKARLSRFAPQFMGYNQHDSQELLAFLLDGLHEDLNRILKKPYIEAKDAGDRPDDIVADEYWHNHLRRNDSVIVHTCQGQFKSTLVCPVCSTVSRMFDPFMYLSLPLPSKTVRPMTVTVVSASGSAGPITITANVQKSGTVADLVRVLTAELSLPATEQLVLAEVYQSKVHQVFSDHQHLSAIGDQDKLVAYRVPPGCPNPVIVNQRARTRCAARLTSPKPSHSVGLYPNWVGTGTPFVIPQSRVLMETGEQLYKLVRAALRPFRTKQAAGGADSSAADLKGKAPVDAEREPSPMVEEVGGQGGVTLEGTGPGISRETSPSMEVSPPESEGDVLEDSAKDISEGLGDKPSQGGDIPRDEGEGLAEEKQQKKARISNGFKLKFFRPMPAVSAEQKSDWVEIPDTADPLPSDFLVAGTYSTERQAVALDWVPRALGHMYDMKVIEDLPAVGASQSSFWNFPFGNSVRQALPGLGKGKEGITLHACLDAFLTEEPLGPDDMWFCPKCKEHRQATKKLDLVRLPDILVVHLKRFSYSRYFKNKIDSLVDFPLKNLDLTPYVQAGKNRGGAGSSTTSSRGSSTSSSSAERVSAGSGESPGEEARAHPGADKGGAEASDGAGSQHSETGKGETDPGQERYVYDLYAVSNHFGGMGGGHYTAYAKHPDDGKWYCFDDSYVSATSESSVKSSAAYVLFYQRVKTKTSNE